jgi:hypothetical protein
LALKSLGFSSLTGKQAVDQAGTFRRQIRSVIEPPAGVSLVLVTDREQRCEVRVVFERGYPRQVGRASTVSWSLRPIYTYILLPVVVVRLLGIRTVLQRKAN